MERGMKRRALSSFEALVAGVVEGTPYSHRKVQNSIFLQARKFNVLLWSLTLVLMITAGSLFAQTAKISGQIRGIVTDTTGAVVSGADVKATNQGTGATRSTKSSGQGEFVISELPAGMYNVSVTKPNFKEFVTQN